MGHKIKKDNDNLVRWSIRASKLKPVTSYPVDLEIIWYEKDRRRDSDNINSGVKFILDGLVAEGILEADGRKQVRDIGHKVRTDRENPRIEVEIKETK